MRKIKAFGERRVRELEEAWGKKLKGWERKRLQVIRLALKHKYSAREIGEIEDINRSTVFEYIKSFREGGIEGLLSREYSPGKPGALDKELKKEFIEKLKEGAFIRAKEAREWIKEKTGKELSTKTVYYHLGKVGGVLKVPRKTHTKKNEAAVEAFKKEAHKRMAEMLGEDSQKKKVRVWVADEHRYGLLPVIRRCWSLKGVRVKAPYYTKYQWGYIYEALEVDGENKTELFFSPSVSKEITKLFLEQISQVDPEAIHVVVWGQAGFHQKDGEQSVPANVRLFPLPPYSPELNPVEKLGDMVKDAIANKVYPSLELLEKAILKELDDFRKFPKRVKQLLGNYSIVSSVNV